MAVYIPEDKVLEIKNAADIVEVVSDVVYLKKAGKNFVGLCPFHSEKTPSFTVSPQKQIFYCFGCATGGNIFSFIMKHDGILFPDAALMLARRYGIHIPTRTLSPEQKRRINERESMLSVNKQAMEFYSQELLGSPSGKRAMTYLKKRGLSREIIDTFRLGYAQEGWDHLLNFFSKKGIPPTTVEKSGLIVQRKNQDGFYDRFRGRIIFPIFESNMHVIGFGGRVLDDSMPKYLNSPETRLYNKSRSLYGLHLAKLKGRQSEAVYIVEGYFDLLALHQHGIQNSVATLGTSITAGHVQILRGFIGKNGKIILVFDSDDAGIKAAQRSIEVFDKGYIDAQILVLPEGYDPDSYLFEFGVDSFLDLVSQAQGVIPFLMNSAVKKHGLSNEGKIRVISEMKGPLASINDKVARSLYIKGLAECVNIDESAVLERVRKITARKGASFKDQGKVLKSKWDRMERQIITMMHEFPQILSEIAERSILDLFEDNDLRSIGQLILKNKDGSEMRVSDLIDLIENKAQKNLLSSLAIGEDIWNHEACLGIITRFESIRNKNKNLLIEKIKEAEARNDTELLLKLLNKKQKMAVLAEKKKMALLK
ncbi:MAG: DNA primase [Deltaproteobacteria bacterium]|nr:DNA primase [Deltaproteobacteria bacterium]